MSVPALVAPGRRPLAVRHPWIGAFFVVLERTACVLALLALSPLLLAIALAVRVDSSGPVLFRQLRVGQYGRTFRILKFRTMRVGADAELQQLLDDRASEMTAYVKITDDPRITRLGRFLRATSLDELPQLANVVAGHMSLVGPRPQTPHESELYGVTDWRRLLVRPGITGLWQVSGRSDLSPTESLELDATYVRDWTPMMDLRLLLRTVKVVLTRRGAV